MTQMDLALHLTFHVFLFLNQRSIASSRMVIYTCSVCFFLGIEIMFEHQIILRLNHRYLLNNPLNSLVSVFYFRHFLLPDDGLIRWFWHTCILRGNIIKQPLISSRLAVRIPGLFLNNGLVVFCQKLFICKSRAVVLRLTDRQVAVLSSRLVQLSVVVVASELIDQQLV